ncbi:chemotaxis protein CheB [Roseovarius arcticus]|uniref:chemotaxis protein CheB n=1 Tax=Roseovarius arcticus TaxID=2547404 RepID=UPI0011100D4A|nr:chemotaxis protein CheB [Roseovarius arcticus]
MENESNPNTAHTQRSDKSALFPIVAIGASAGGLEVIRKLLNLMPANTGCAFVIIQHLDPNHKSMMVDLLARDTTMAIVQATHGMVIEPNCIYVIPPQHFLSVCDGELRLLQPEPPHRVHLPFDFFLRSLAAESGPRAIGIVLSGTGADGSVGLTAVDEAGGLVIAQVPSEAAYDGMPLNAIETGVVAQILPLADIPAALIEYAANVAIDPHRGPGPSQPVDDEPLAAIVELLRGRTSQDFSHYKKGTLMRRIGRRMSILAIDSINNYIDKLRHDRSECQVLAKYLLIHVTRFFRDTDHFQDFARYVSPELVRKSTQGGPIRVWVPACSTGEEAYSIAMLLLDEFAAAGRRPELKIFASDVSPEAIAFCRSGLYPPSIAADVPPERLAKYFARESGGYQVTEALRNTVTFTVQDLLSDPPFSRLDLVSCRNMLIYLEAGEQEKVLHLLHYALREDGYLWLGSAESIGNLAQHYQRVQGTKHIYRRIGHGRLRARDTALSISSFARAFLPRSARTGDSDRSSLGAAVQRRLLEISAPATVVVDSMGQALYFFGPTDRYLRIAEGIPGDNISTMLRNGLSIKYHAAIRQAKRDQDTTIVMGARMRLDGADFAVQITVRPMEHKGDALLLVSFSDEPADQAPQSSEPPVLARHDDDLKQELEITRRELDEALRDLEASNQDLVEFTEEAGMLNEEFMSTNEELEATREELQSLNEELTTSNNQLQETLEERDKTASDLHNILTSSDIATLFLDADLNIRYFTPAAVPLFKLIPSDIGRPLADLSISFGGVDLIADARRVLAGQTSVKRDVVNSMDVWFLCSLSPMRSQGDSIDGVVVNLADISDLAAAKEKAELANVGKSRFLAATSHNLRQPLQTLSLVLGAMKRQIRNNKALALLNRAEASLSVMATMLNTLLNINQLEAGVISPKFAEFPVNGLLDTIKEEFAEEMADKGLKWRVVPCGLTIRSDRLLLTDMVRNLVSNAIRYTETGSVLLGCRRHGDRISIEVWDTGIGIAEDMLSSIFDDYFRASGGPTNGSFGLGLSIAHQIGTLLGSPPALRSTLGKGSVFYIEVPCARAAKPRPKRREEPADNGGACRPARVLLIEDDISVHEAITLLLSAEGHDVFPVRTPKAALELVTIGKLHPDLLISDYNLPGNMNGVQAAKALCKKVDRAVPVIILTGDLRLTVTRDIAESGFMKREKPLKADKLLSDIRKICAKLERSPPPTAPGAAPAAAMVYVVDDDRAAREAMQVLLEQAGYSVDAFADAPAFLASYKPRSRCCIITDVRMPGMTGLELLAQIGQTAGGPPTIVVTGKGDISMAVQAIRAGAIDFIEKPTAPDALLAAVDRALRQAASPAEKSARQIAAASRFSRLTKREREVAQLVVAGHANKEIAARLGISQRTVETHRAAAMKKVGVETISDLVRLEMAAQGN